MGAGHNHSHGAEHGNTEGSTTATGGLSHRARLVIAFGITLTIVFAQAIGAVITGSLALLVDTAHMLTDAAGLLMALIAAALMNRPASKTHTWGLRRAEVLSAMAQAALLFAVGMFALVEGVRRLFEPPEIASSSLLIFGIIGLVANVASMLVLVSGRSANLNMKAAFLEVVNDALGSIAVIVSAILISTLGWYQADAVAGILIAILIVPRTIVLLRATFGVLLERTPKGIDLDEVRAHILGVDHVVDVHDLHISLISSDLPVLTAHVVVDDECFTDGHAARMLPQLQACVAGHFPISIEHSTFQIETQLNATQEHVAHG